RLTGTRDVEQRASHLMVAYLDCSLALIRHMAIGTRNSTASMYTLIPQLEFGMLGFEDQSAGFAMDVVLKILLVVIALDLLNFQPIAPRVSDDFFVPLEVVLDMTLATDKATQLLSRGQGVDIVVLYALRLVPMFGPGVDAGQVGQGRSDALRGA